MNDLVSIIMACYNSEKYIRDTVDSVLRQSYPTWELIIIDDNSKDNSVSIVNTYINKDTRIKLIEQKNNNGPAITRNLGIKEAKGRFITFLDSDDIWEQSFIEESLKFQKEKNVTFTFASYYRRNEDFSRDNGTFYVPKKVNYSSLLKTCPISCLTAMYDTKKLNKMYMPMILKRQDYGLWLAILKKTDYAYGINKPLATYRMREGSVSRNKFKAAQYQWRIYRKTERLNIFKSIYFFVHYAYNGFKKYK